MTDIREIDGLWCDDITFCQEQCGWKSCPRNRQNIRDRTVPHSFSVDIPADCPKKQEAGEAGMRKALEERLRDVIEEKRPQMITWILHEIVSEMCDKYCKYPEMYSRGDPAADLPEELKEHCDKCPLNMIG